MKKTIKYEGLPCNYVEGKTDKEICINMVKHYIWKGLTKTPRFLPTKKA